MKSVQHAHLISTQVRNFSHRFFSITAETSHEKDEVNRKVFLPDIFLIIDVIRTDSQLIAVYVV
jgi:hypothetical protein